MIERQTISGRPATVAWLTTTFQPTDQVTAHYAKVMFDDGDTMFLVADDSPEGDGADEAEAWSKHRQKHQKPFGKQPKRGVVLGHTMAQWAGYFVKTDLARIDNAIRTGLIAGLDNTEIARRVIGSVGLRGVDGVTEITRQQIAHLGRSALKSRSQS